MKKRFVPRVGAPGCRKLTFKHTLPYNLNPLAKRQINDFLEPDDFAAIKDTKKLELQTPLSLREFRATAAEMILEVMHIKTIESGEILTWDSGVYRSGGRRKIEALCQKLADDHQIVISNGAVSEIIGIIKRRTSCDFSDFDIDPMQMCVGNGILDLESMKLRPHDPEFLTVVKIPWDYNPAASCPGIEKAVEEIVGAENLPLIWEIFGHFLIKDYRVKRFLVLVGEKDSGKSTLLRLMSEFLGIENISAVSMQNLSDRFMKAELAGKLANISDDLPKGRIRDSSMIKRLSGQSRIQAEEKGKAPFIYENHAKLVFSSNYPPRVDEPTDADFGRFMIILLHNKFGGRGVDAKPKDPTLLKKLITPEEMSGLLNKALEGIRRLQSQNWEFSYKLTEAWVAARMTGGTNQKRDECYALPRHVEAESRNECYRGRSRPPACHTRKDRICCAGFTILQALRCLVIGWWR